MLEKRPEDRLLSHLIKARSLSVVSQRAAAPIKGEIRVASGSLFGKGLAGRLFLINVARH